MSMEYIRRYYGVPAKRGARVAYTGSKGVTVTGVITGSDCQYLRIRLDGERRSFRYHPTWELTYLDALDALPGAGVTDERPKP
jgi:hypothetical protein